MKAHEFDSTFDDGEDVSAHLDWSRAERVNLGTGQAAAESRPGSLPPSTGRRDGAAAPGSRSPGSGSPTG